MPRRAVRRACVFIDERRQIYKKLVVSEDGTRLLGGILIGAAEEYGAWLQMVQNGLPLPTNPERLLFPPTDDAGALKPPGLAALPDAAQICSCNNVRQGDSVRGDCGRREDIRRAQAMHQGGELLRWVHTSRDTSLEG